MKKRFIFLGAITCLASCTDANNKAVEQFINQNSSKEYFRFYTNNVGAGYDHYIYVPENANTIFTQINYTNWVMEYLDSNKVDTPVKAITFVRSLAGMNTARNEIDNNELVKNALIVEYWLTDNAHGNRIDGIGFASDNGKIIVEIPDSIK